MDNQEKGADWIGNRSKTEADGKVEAQEVIHIGKKEAVCDAVIY